MIRISKFAAPAIIAAAMSFASVPAKAQFGGMNEAQMEQMAPMLDMMKQKMGKKRFGPMVKLMAPWMEQMKGGDGMGGFGGFGGGGFGGGFPGMVAGGFDMSQM